MFQSSKQLKDKLRNLAKKKSTNEQILMRNYMMERFLERISLSKYRSNFILKGGVLIASLVGIESRSTQDIDTTIRELNVSLPKIAHIVQEIIDISIVDGIIFQIKNLEYIMQDSEYPGIRVSLLAQFDGTITPFKFDISVGDTITPQAIQYSYKLMFEDRSIGLLAYNLETVLAEKLETIIRRYVTNTRMRDFYDVYILGKLYGDKISNRILKLALEATAYKRESFEHLT